MGQCQALGAGVRRVEALGSSSIADRCEDIVSPRVCARRVVGDLHVVDEDPQRLPRSGASGGVGAVAAGKCQVEVAVGRRSGADGGCWVSGIRCGVRGVNVAGAVVSVSN